MANSVFRQIFTAHPETVGETYGEHFAQATYFSGALFRAAFACFAHALVPCLFKKTASSIIVTLHQRMVTHRAKEAVNQPPARPQATSESV